MLFSHTFTKNSLSADGANGTTAYGGAVKPQAPTLANAACLTVPGSTGPIPSCTGASTATGSGALELTSTATQQEGAVFSTVSVPSGGGLDISYTSSQWGYTGGKGADGIGFVLAAVDPTNPLSPAEMGQPGGSLGYSANDTNSTGVYKAGLNDGYLGIGFDTYGNFINKKYQGTGCTGTPSWLTTGTGSAQVTVRGPGNGTVGYCALTSTAATDGGTPVNLTGGATGSRSAANVPVEVVINTTTTTMTTTSGLSVPAGKYEVAFTPIGGSKHTLTGTLPNATGTLPAAWLGAAGVPKQIAFGWVASTGGTDNNHTVSGVEVQSLKPVPLLGLDQSEYHKTLTKGSPVTWTEKASTGATGASETQPVTVTDTMPTGVTPTSAGGQGWVCSPPAGQKVTCTYTPSSPIPPGTTLPPLYVNGTVTGTGVTTTTLQKNNVTVVSSSNGDPASTSTAVPGTLPPAPVVTKVTPSVGPLAGGNTVTISGTNLTDATVVEIGTATQIADGVATSEAPCQTGQSAGCFKVTGSKLLVPAPAHAAGVDKIDVVTQGEAGSAGYTYTAPAFAAGSTVTRAFDAGEALSYTPTEIGGVGTVHYTFTGLPSWAHGNATTGVVTGTVAGTSGSYTVTATDADSQTATQTVDYTVNAAPSFAPHTSVALSWDVSTPSFDYAPSGDLTGGTAPFTWELTGTLPAGLTFHATTGSITGTPTAVGTKTVTLRATDASSVHATQSVTIAVTPVPSPGTPATSSTGSSSASGDAGAGFAYTPPAPVGGAGPYTWDATGLPAGLHVNPTTGAITGTSSTTGTFHVVETATDANGHEVTEDVTIALSPPPAISTKVAPATSPAGTAYSGSMAISGGTGPYTWSVTTGQLPPGLTLDASTGSFAGTPTTPGTFTFTITVIDAAGRTAAEQLTIVVKPANMNSHSIAATPTGKGYWTASTTGQVYAFGGAKLYGNATNLALNQPISGIESTPSGKGYWLVAYDGGVFAYGDAQFYGSMGAHPLNQSVVGLTETPDGKGYWLVASDGGVFAFGNANFYGSMGGHPLNQPVTGMAAASTGRGYWLVASDGGVFAFGTAQFFGSMGGHPLNQPVTGMAATPSGKGYWLVAGDGGVFAFGNAKFYGTMVGHPLNQPIEAVVSTPDGKGYWMDGGDGGVFTFGDAGFYGSMGGSQVPPRIP